MIRKLFLFYFLVLPALANAQCSNTAYGNWTCIQFKLNQASAFNTGGSVTFTSNVGASHLIVIQWWGCDNSSCSGAGSVTLSGLSDNINGSGYVCPAGAFTDNATDPGHQGSFGTCYFSGTGAGSTTISFSIGSANWRAILATEWSNSNGPISTLVADASGNVFGQNSTTPTVTTSGSTTKANDLIISSMSFASPTVTATSTGAYGTLGNGCGASGVCQWMQAKNGAALSSYSSGWSASPATFGPGAVLTILALTAPPAPGSGFPMVIKNRSLPHKKIPWDNRRRKLEIVRI